MPAITTATPTAPTPHIAVSPSTLGDRFSYMAGLRFEQYQYTGHLLDSTGGSFGYHMTGLYPSVFLTEKLGSDDVSELHLNFSRRVNRPQWWQITPQINYSNPQNPQAGNPHIRPENTNLVELGLQHPVRKHWLQLHAVPEKYPRPDDGLQYPAIQRYPAQYLRECQLHQYLRSGDHRTDTHHQMVGRHNEPQLFPDRYQCGQPFTQVFPTRASAGSPS